MLQEGRESEESAANLYVREKVFYVEKASLPWYIAGWAKQQRKSSALCYYHRLTTYPIYMLEFQLLNFLPSEIDHWPFHYAAVTRSWPTTYRRCQAVQAVGMHAQLSLCFSPSR